MTEEDSTNKIGKVFIWIAWLFGIALLVFVFQDLLDGQYNPNQSPDIYLNEQGRAEVHLLQNRQGHYVVNGTINGSKVTFLLDTGATQVSIPAHIADELRLSRGQSGIAQTANGSVRVFQTTLEQLSIGNIFMDNVAASINPGMRSNEILLGMSALRRVEFSQTGKQLILRERN